MKTEVSDYMRSYEAAYETHVPQGLWMTVRLDGRGFTTFTKKGDRFEKPFDIAFHEAMLATVDSLMNCGLEIRLAHTQSDEISLVVSPDEESFGRRVVKILTVLAGQASAFFSSHFDEICVFDARMLALPDSERVSQYLLWRQEDAHRNALSAYAYWALREEGLSARSASKKLEGASRSQKNELLFERGINFNEVPEWQKRGSCVVWETFLKEGFNPKTKEVVFADRRRLVEKRHLSMKDDFRDEVEAWLRP